MGEVEISHDLCPPEEIEMRSRLKRLHRFETEDGCQPIKEFCRSAAGTDNIKRRNTVRSIDTLHRVMDLLINSVCAKHVSPLSDETKLLDVYDFVSDRIRSVRQDITIQNLFSDSVVKILMQAVRFYIYFSVRLSHIAPGISSQYDPKINFTHCVNCLSTLLDEYSRNVFNDKYCSDGHIEALSFYILLTMDLTNLKLILDLPRTCRSIPLLSCSYQTVLAYCLGNYVRFFRLVRTLPPLHLAACHTHFNTFRRQALLAMSRAFCARATAKLPLKMITGLGLTVKESREFLESAGVHLNTDGDSLIVTKGLSLPPMTNRAFPASEMVISRISQSTPVSDLLFQSWHHDESNPSAMNELDQDFKRLVVTGGQ